MAHEAQRGGMIALLLLITLHHLMPSTDPAYRRITLLALLWVPGGGLLIHRITGAPCLAATQ